MTTEGICKTVDEMFKYEDIFNFCHYGQLIDRLEFKFQPPIFRDRHLHIRHNIKYGDYRIELIEIGQTVFECQVTKDQLDNLNNYTTRITAFRHGAWEDYLSSLPGRIKRAHETIEALYNARSFFSALKNFSPINDSGIFQKADMPSKV